MSEEPKYKYMMTCGHMSVDGKCPFECPESEVLYDVEKPESILPESIEGISSESANG